jgi:hypothetical protein
MTEPTVTIVDVEPKIITVVERSTLAVEVTERSVPGPPGSTGPTGPAGPIGPQGVPGPGNSFQTVATATALPAAASNAGRAYYVIDTAVTMISDGSKWRLLYGDTGMRNVASLMTHPSIVQTSPVPIGVLQRSGNVVEFYADFLTVAAPSSPMTIIALPVGFRSTNPWGVYGLLTCYANYARATIGFPPPDGTISLYGAPANNEDRYHGTWITSDPWPSVLPGTALQVPA